MDAIGLSDSWCYRWNNSSRYDVDASGWRIIAVAYVYHATRDREFLNSFWYSMERAVTWLTHQAIDAPELLNSPPAGDWMDSSIQRWRKELYYTLLYPRVI